MCVYVVDVIGESSVSKSAPHLSDWFPQPAERFRSQQQQLKDMGFYDEAENERGAC
jgi:hypothetical protein